MWLSTSHAGDILKIVMMSYIIYVYAAKKDQLVAILMKTRMNNVLYILNMYMTINILYI